MRADIASHLRHETSGSSVRLSLTIEEQDGGFLGTLTAFDPSGSQSSRRIHGATCLDVAHALAFLTGLVIELGGHLEPESPPAPEPPPLSPRAVAMTGAAPSYVDVSTVLLMGTRGGFGPTLHVTGEAGAEVATRIGALSPSLRLSGFVGESSLGGGSESASLWFAGGRLEVCPLRFGSPNVVLRPCAGAEFGRVHAQGQTSISPRTAVEFWASGETTLRLQWLATKSLFAELGGGPEFFIVRTRYYFQPDRTLYVAPWLTARGAFGLGLRF